VTLRGRYGMVGTGSALAIQKDFEIVRTVLHQKRPK